MSGAATPGRGQCHALLLAAGELMGVLVQLVGEPHLREQRAGAALDFGEDGLPVLHVIGLFLRQKLRRELDVLQDRIFGGTDLKL
jgi:hypothetical protein